VSDVEILARVERRRKWTIEEKAALIAEVETEGGKVKLVARRHRMSESLLYNCRGRSVGIGGVRTAGGIWRSGRRGFSDVVTISATATAGRKPSGSDRDRLANRCPRQRRCVCE
jgi:Transposase